MIAIWSFQYWCFGSYLNWPWLTPIYSSLTFLGCRFGSHDKQYIHCNVVNTHKPDINCTRTGGRKTTPIGGLLLGLPHETSPKLESLQQQEVHMRGLGLVPQILMCYMQSNSSCSLISPHAPNKKPSAPQVYRDRTLKTIS